MDLVVADARNESTYVPALEQVGFTPRLATRPSRRRARYADAKRTSADVSNGAGEAVMDYNLRKQPVVREILDRMFRAHGMLPAADG